MVLDEGELEGFSGFWVEDDETGEEGFLDGVEEIFYAHDDENECWIARPVRGRRLRRGSSKGKGKKRKNFGKGRRKFRSYRKQGPRRRSYEAEATEAAMKAKGKGNGNRWNKKPGKGNSKY